MRAIRTYSGVVLVLFLSGSYSLTSAGIRPSFDLEGCSWNATHIVVATEGKAIDGVFRVLESWRGDLNPGDTIRIPELASFKPPSSRTVTVWTLSKPNSNGVVVTGQRMVLFLKKDSDESSSAAGLDELPSSRSSHWKSPSSYDDWSVSVAWIEEKKAYAYIQVINPGDSLLVPLSQSEDELKNSVLEVKNVQDLLNESAAIVDPAKRAEALAPFAHHSLYRAQNAAFEALEKGGKAALPVLRQMLADDSLLDIHAKLVEALAQAGKGEVGSDLTAVIERSLEFWRVTGPTLKRGWWNGKGFDSLDDAVPLRDRYSEVYSALRALEKRPHRESEKVVSQFRELWRSLPQLEEIGLDQMSQACDGVLRELDRLKFSVNTIRFEGLRFFDESSLLRTLRDERVITEGSPLSPEQIEQAQASIKRVMASQGYAHANVVARNDQSDPSLRMLTFVVSEGEPIGIAEIRFTGNKVFSSSELNARLTKCREEETGSDSKIYDAEELSFCLRRLDNFARSKGYLRAKFHDPESEERKDGFVLTVRADEDILYRLGEITIEAPRAVPTDRVRSILSLRPGEAANGETIGKWLFEDLKKIYGELGYIEYIAEIEPEFRVAANGTNEGIVDFKITIEEGRQFRVRTIKFQGSKLPEKVLYGHLRVRPGDVFNQRLFQETIAELNEMNLFENVDKDGDVDFATDQKNGLIDIVIKLRLTETKSNWDSR